MKSTEQRIQFSDSIPINTTDTFCIDPSLLDGPIVSLENTCPENAGERILFEIDTITNCVTYTALEAGTETACIRACDSLGNCYTTELIITAFDPRLQFDTTIIVGDIDTFCIDTSLFAGTIISIENVCDSMNMDSIIGTIPAVNFAIDTATRCIIYEGIAVGNGQACIEICNSAGQCDTVLVNIMVTLDSIRMPIAIPDFDTTDAGEEIVIGVLANDTLFTTDSLEVTIEALPPNGEAFVNPDGTITYTPNDNYCDTTDVFMYMVCNVLGCDTARVTVFIKCTEVMVLNGFSPNGDGMNDSLIIQGLGTFPMNRLQIFDRRGTRVFNASPYQNNWKGDWEGKELPDGIYFYMLDLGDGTRHSGYIVLRR